MNVFENQNADLLISALLALDNREECRAFLEDIMTTRELLDISQRIAVAKLLSEGYIQAQIAEKTGASAATISRVNRAYEYGADGYKTVLERISK